MHSLNICVSVIQNSKGKKLVRLGAQKLESMEIRMVGYSALGKTVFSWSQIYIFFLQKAAFVLCV